MLSVYTFYSSRCRKRDYSNHRYLY